jgi:hypothetical protein
MGNCINSIIIPAAMVSINGIANIIGKIYDYAIEQWDELTHYRIIINTKDNPRLKRAIFEEIKSRNLHINRNTIHMADDFQKPEAEVAKGSYQYNHDILGSIKIDVDTDKIVFKTHKLKSYSQWNDKIILRQVLETIYITHNAVTKIMMFYTAEGNNWTCPVIREPRNFDNLKLTESMRAVLDDFVWFNSEDGQKEYAKNGWPYRRGYFLHGETGTGKSTMAEVLSFKYERTVYMLTLNAKDMTDNILINLCSSVPRNSIILIDEIDKQLDTVKNNPTISISTGGLLTAIDGPQRINNGTIVILTSNKKDILPEDELKSLLRPGRIDRIFEFK